MSLLSRLVMVILMAILMVLPAAPARALTERECRQDAQELLAEISRNRQNSVELYQRALAEEDAEAERERLKEQMERIWYEEEMQLGMADQLLRDCLLYLQSRQQKSVDQ